MTIRKVIDSSNDFWMLIADLSLSPEEFTDLAFPSSTYDWIIHSEYHIETLINQTLAEFADMRQFVQLCKEQGKIKWTKTIKEEDSKEPLAFYLCFGEDPDGMGQNISFRIDQNWDKYIFSIEFDSEIEVYLRKFVLPLSGMHINGLEFPEIILSKDLLGHPEKFFGIYGGGQLLTSEEIDRGVKDYFLICVDYWGVATLLDKHGMVWQWNVINNWNFKIRATHMDLQTWMITELANPFHQRPKPDWI